MYLIASLTVLICSVSSSGISIENSSSSASTSSTTASESALRSSVNDASGLHLLGAHLELRADDLFDLASTFISFSCELLRRMAAAWNAFLHQKAAVDADNLSGDVARLAATRGSARRSRRRRPRRCARAGSA